MAIVAFDILKLAPKLEAAGFSSTQAQGASEALSETMGDEMVTKTYLREELAPIKAEITILKWMSGFTLAAVMAVFYMLLKAKGI